MLFLSLPAIIGEPGYGYIYASQEKTAPVRRQESFPAAKLLGDGRGSFPARALEIHLWRLNNSKLFNKNDGG